MSSRRNRGGKGGKKGGYVGLERWLLLRGESPLNNLTPLERSIYLKIKARFIGVQEWLPVSYSELRDKNISSHTTISKALKRLKEKGWIRIREENRTRYSGEWWGCKGEFQLTFKHDKFGLPRQ